MTPGSCDCLTTQPDGPPGNVVVRSDDTCELRWLLSLDEHAQHCAACGRALPHMTVSVLSDGWRDASEGPGPALAALRDRVAHRVAGHLHAILANLARAGTDDEAMAIARLCFGELTAEAMAAQRLRDLLPQNLPDSATPTSSRLDRCHAVALLEMAVTAALGPQPLSSHLRRYLAPGLVSTQTVTMLSTFLDRIDWRALAPDERWVSSAVLASAATAAGTADPSPVRTAEAYVGLRWAELVGTQPDRPWLREAAAELLNADALADVAMRLCHGNDAYRARAAVILAEIGHQDTFQRSQRQARSEGEDSLAAAVAELETTHAADASPVTLARTLYRVLYLLRAEHQDQALHPVAARALTLAGDNTQTRGLLLTVAGAFLKDARRPREYLSLAGEQPAAWEVELAPFTRVALAVERSNALTLAGRPDLALAAVMAIDNGDLAQLPVAEQRAVARNRAMLHRQAGAPDRSLKELVELLAGAASDEERLELLQSLVNAAQFLGNAALAEDYLEQALALAHGPQAAQRPFLLALRATTDAVQGRTVDLAPVLSGGRDPMLALAAGAAVAAALEHEVTSLSPSVVQEVLTLLRQVVEPAAVAGDRVVELNGLRAIAAILDVIDPDAAADVWASVSQRRGPDRADPIELACLAHHRYRKGDQAGARELLTRVPEALTMEVGGYRDLIPVLNTTGRLKAAFRKLGDDVLAARPRSVADIRLVAELQRDALGQVRARAALAARPRKPQPADTGVLAPASGHLWVLEWLDTTPGLLGLLTQMDPAGRTDVMALPPVSFDPGEVSSELRARLNGWLSTSAGDPLDHPGWATAQHWLRTALAGAEKGDHLVFIEHRAVSGLPWHAIDDTPWTTSYAASWTAMVRARAQSRSSRTRFGLLSVPAANESGPVREVFTRVRVDIRDWCQAQQFTLEERVDAAADRAAALAMLGRCDLLTIHCHGLVKAADHDIALMLAADGQLPPQSAREVELRSAHQLSWRDLQELPQSPEIVLSAACSSGTSMLAGLGERLGLYGALRHAGTRTVIAPAWDGLAVDVIHQLEAVRHALAAGRSPAEAVKAAAEEAATHLPSWRARALAIDGDWA